MRKIVKIQSVAYFGLLGSPGPKQRVLVPLDPAIPVVLEVAYLSNLSVHKDRWLSKLSNFN